MCPVTKTTNRLYEIETYKTSQTQVYRIQVIEDNILFLHTVYYSNIIPSFLKIKLLVNKYTKNYTEYMLIT